MTTPAARPEAGPGLEADPGLEAGVGTGVAAEPVLVLLAAGLGTRFGGVKPLAPVGANGEPLLEVALRQAAAAGFTSAVVVTGGATAAVVEDAVAAMRPALAVTCARQDGAGPPRDKPWGTVAAALGGAGAAHGAGGRVATAAGAVESAIRRDVVVANGDDVYGTAGLAAARAWSRGERALAGGRPGSAAPAMAADVALVAYRAGRTLSTSGGVSRAIPIVGTDGRVAHLAEHRGVHRDDTGAIVTDTGARLGDDDPVSMNLWVLRPSALDAFAAAFAEFVGAHAGDATAELGLPDAVGALLDAGGLSVELLVVDSPWHGVTWAADTGRVRAALIAESG